MHRPRPLKARPGLMLTRPTRRVDLRARRRAAGGRREPGHYNDSCHELAWCRYNQNVNWWFCERLILRTDSTPEALVARLGTIVTVGRVYGKWPPNPFEGSIEDMHFKIALTLRPHPPSRGAGYKSNTPVIIGDIVRVPSGSEVRVLMRIQKDAAVFLAVLLAGMLWMAAVAVWNAAALGGVSAPACAAACGRQIAVAGGLSVLLYAAMTISFQSGVKKARKLLCVELACQEVD